jgi:hypothetical protein
MKKKQFLFCAHLMMLCLYLQGQSPPLQLVSAAGSSIKTATHQIDWSVGELQVTTYTATNGSSIAQGFHQGNITITALKNLVELPFNIVVSPNPTMDFINVTLETPTVEGITCTLTDAQGKTLLTEKWQTSTQSINCTGFANGIYFITIEQKDKGLKSFKIIKN